MKIESIAILGILGVGAYVVVTNLKGIQDFVNNIGKGTAAAADATIGNFTGSPTSPLGQLGADQGAAFQSWISSIIGPPAVQKDVGVVLQQAAAGSQADLESRIQTLQNNMATWNGTAYESIAKATLEQLKQLRTTPETPSPSATPSPKYNPYNITIPDSLANLNITPANNPPTPIGSEALAGLTSNMTGTASSFNPSAGAYAWAQPGSPLYNEGKAKGLIK